MAVNCCVLPTVTVGFAGVTAIENRVAAVTVIVVDPLTLHEVAEIVEVPAFKAEAKPPAFTVAVAVLDEAQATLPVRFCVLLSE